MASIGLDYWLCADRSALAESALPPHAKFLFFFLRVPKKARDSLVLDKRPLSVHPLFTVPTIQLIFFFQFCVVTLERHCVYIFCMHRRRHNKECGCVMCQRRRVHPKPMTKKAISHHRLGRRHCFWATCFSFSFITLTTTYILRLCSCVTVGFLRCMQELRNCPTTSRLAHEILALACAHVIT
ncbi:hypothetical protein TW95_gp0243 [Pandoravirus inopinatum]|uniref:Uncharacterized protein n=1 Tax=Pandoravirus inopinatum TaxID=1605721 RepID=A0A0B5JBN6_9VIRU|nr:hypothetical protein TW95_gp0243 [Pandoravirus inopinatum]AJF96977.1 hypothetical protein [Pandoravirus inopinatum]